MQNLSENLYCVDSIVQLEQIAINQLALDKFPRDKLDRPAYELMTRAGEAVFDVIKTRYSDRKKILVLCGAGNNAGDGYVIARLAKCDGYDVNVISLIDPSNLSAAALTAYNDWSKIGKVTQFGNRQQDAEIPEELILEQCDIIVDALLGTGLRRQLSEQWCAWIKAINHSSAPVISVDVPSGLYADTGAVALEAIQADVTVCFVGLKQGMFTSQAKDYCGEIIYSDLALSASTFSQVEPDASLIKNINYSLLTKRKATSHKGRFGHVLIVGGNSGMPGAVILAARAALRTGAGLVTIITIKQHLAAICNAVPEAMIKVCTISSSDSSVADGGTADAPSVNALFQQAFIHDITHVAVGMGLGQDEWSIAVLQHCLRLKKPVLIDADGLNLLAQQRHLVTEILSESITLTPHPGEAARLLSSDKTNATKEITTIEIQNDRFSAVRKIHELFDDKKPCAVVLKGSGTLIFDGELIKICNIGSAAMATPGMGDVLSGIIIALQAQGLTIGEAVEQGVCLHACAAQNVSAEKTRGLLASDIIEELQNILQ